MFYAKQVHLSVASLSSSFASMPKPCDHSVCLEKQMEEQPPRRSANYAPTLWTDDEIQSLARKSIIKEEEEENACRLSILKEQVKQLLQTTKEVDQQLQLIDSLHQLGVAYHFKKDIKSALSALSAATLEDACTVLSDNLHATALLFRHLREYGFSISEDVFIKFKDDKGSFKASLLDHPDGLLSLYEACSLAKQGEAEMDQALAFATQHLKNLTAGSTSSSLEPYWREQVLYALELPRAWRVERLHARWFIEVSQRHAAVNPLLLEFAKLDFNRIQPIYQQELCQLSRWWTNLGLVDKLRFARDRLVESYFFSVGCQFEPHFGPHRVALTKQTCLIAIIDDAYDVYGTLNELQLFTDAVDRWNVSSIDKLPEYMKLIFLATFNLVSDEAYKVLRDKGLNIVPHLKRAWEDLCKAYLIESTWYHNSYIPKLEEYLENACISIGVPNYFTLACCLCEYLTQEHLELVNNYTPIIRGSSLIFRLFNDLGTSNDELQRGDVPKSIQCYMHQNDATEDVARGHIEGMIYEYLRAINGARNFTCCYEEYLIRLATNIAGITHWMYGSADTYGKPDQSIKHAITFILFDPIVF